MKIIIIPNMPVMSGRHYCIARALVEQGHEVHYMMWALPYGIKVNKLLLHLATSIFSKEYKYEKFTMHKVSRLPYFWPVINGWLFKYQIRKLYKKLGADIIFTESYTNETEVPKDLPFIYDLADDYAAPADVYGSPIYKLAFKLLGVRNVMKRQCKNALAVTAVSEALYKYAKKYNDKVFKLPNGVDKEIIEAVKKDKSTYPKNKYSMIYVTGFGPWSRAIETMQTVVKLRKEFPFIDLTLVGKGTETPKIKNFILDNHVEKYIHYLGYISDRKKLYALINKSAIGLNISDKNKWRDAAHPIKVLEYSALCKKVVSTDLEEVKKLKFPNVYIFSDKNKKDNLINIMRKTLQDKRNNTDYTDTANKVLREYNWKKLTSKLLKIIDVIKKTAISKQVNRIVHVSPAYPPALGGLEKVVQALARIQSQSGINVSVITSNQNTHGVVSKKDSFPIYRLKTWTIANTNIMPMLLFKLFKLNHDDIVHLHVVQAYMPEIVYLASKIKGFRYIAQIHFHLDAPPIGKLGFLLKYYKEYILKYVLRNACKVIVMTGDYEKILHRKYGIQKTKLSVIPNATGHKIANTSKALTNHTLRLLSVGRLSSQKNTAFLLESLSFYAKKYNKNFHLSIVGDGEQKDNLKKDIKRLGLKNLVSLRHRLGDKALEKTYKESDIFLSASMHEAFGIVFIEAMTKGLPIVSTDIPVVRNIVRHRKNGLLVKQNIIKFADALHELGSNKRLYAALSQNNIKDVKNYSWKESNKQFMHIYTSHI